MKLFKLGASAFVTLVMLVALGCASTATGSSTGELIDDTVITAKVKTAIFNDKDLSVNEINVETFKGVVQLSGFVSERSDIAKATAVTRSILGVSSVKNDLMVK